MGNNQPKPDAFAFAERFHTAIDRIPGAPPRTGRGRAAWLAKQLNVKPVTSGGWLKGEYLPTPDRVRTIAKLAGVTYDWLYFGTGVMDSGAAQPGREDGVSASQPVRDADLRIALRLAAEAIGRDLYLPPQDHTDLVLTVLDLLEGGMPEARVLEIAKRLAGRLANRGNTDDEGQAGTGGKAARNHR